MQPVQAWEYKVIHRRRTVAGVAAGEWDTGVVAQLPSLGEEGWELIAVTTRSSEGGASSAGVTTDELWIFKRPRQIFTSESMVVVAQAEHFEESVTEVGVVGTTR